MTPLRWRTGSLRGRRLAIDLGTARTRIAIAGHGLIVDEPTILAYGDNGRPQAAGWAAWDCAVSGPSRLSYPIRHARVVDAAAAVQLLQLLLSPFALNRLDMIAVGIPAGLFNGGRDELVAAVAAATSAPVIGVDAPLASALGAGLAVDDDHPDLVLDLGAGIVQLAAMWDGQARAQERIQLSSSQQLHEPGALRTPLRTALRGLLDSMPERLAADAAAGPLWLLGGGALTPGMCDTITDALVVRACTAPRPRTATVLGLSRYLSRLPNVPVPA